MTADSLTVEPNGDDETLLRVSKQLAELREALAEVERKLTSEDGASWATRQYTFARNGRLLR
jgi:hypothetical protein